MKKASVAVIIPCFNMEQHLRQTLESVLRQTVPVAEIIVIDNNSTDKTAEIAVKLGATVLRERKQGMSAARNTGMRASSADWIAFLDGDDIWHPRKIELQMRAARAFPQSKIISCEYKVFYEDTGKTSYRPRLKDNLPAFDQYVSRSELLGFCREVDLAIFSQLYLRTSGLVIHRTILDEIGWFDENLPMNNDIEFYLRILRGNSIALVKKVLLEYRKHSANISNNHELNMSDSLRNLEKTKRFPDNYLPGAAEAFKEFMQKRVMLAMVQKAQMIKAGRIAADSGEDIFRIL